MKKVLVAEDQVVTLTIITVLLESCGFSVVGTTNSLEVMPLLEQEAPDILVIDIVMPEKDGIENIREIRKSYSDLLIIAISSNHIYLDVAEKLGADHSYQKPIISGQFVEFIKAVI